AEAGRGLAGCGVDRVELRSRHEQDPRRRARIAFPVADAARRNAARASLTFGPRDDVRPELLARLAVERDDAIAARHIHHAADDDRDRGGVAVQAIGPGA